MYKTIKKRDGRLVDFDLEKLASAITKAGRATREFGVDEAKKLANKVIKKAEETIKSRIPGVEQIQDVVEEVLMGSNYHKTAKAYILYREERNRIRNSKTRLMTTYQTIANAKATEDSEVKRGNANVDGDSAMGKMLQFGAEGSKEFAKSFLKKPEHVVAHDNGDIHVHDLDFYATGTLTCCQTDPIPMLERGFNTGHGFLRTPQSIGSYAALAAILLQANQNEQHGGQSIPNFDYAMAEGVNKTYRKSLKSNLAKYNKFADKKIEAEFDGITLGDDEKLAKKKIPSIVTEEAKFDTDKQTHQAMEGLVHNLNTMHSRAGAQVPFTSLNFGTDTTPEGRLVSKAFLEATNEGLGKGETPIFPISIFKVKEGINYNPTDPNYDLFVRSMEVSSKRLFPNFVFIDAPYNIKFYDPKDYRTEAVAMGCRTRVMSSVFPETNGIGVRRGNLSFTTVNLPRIGIKHGIALGERDKADWDGFYHELDEKIALVADQMLERYEFQAERTVKNFPFLMGQGNWFGSEKLGPNDKLRDVIKHGTLSMGFIGLAETLVAMLGKHHGEDEEALERGYEIISHIREKLDDLSKKHTKNFSLLATPAEGIAGRFTKLDRDEYGKIKGVTDREFYTNSFHIPVYYQIGAFDKIAKEAPFHELCNAGHITYIELDGDPSQNIDAFEKIIRAMKDAGIGYGSINHPVDRDPECGFSGIIPGDTCPSCGRNERDGEYGFERLRRITGYLVGSLERWNDAKQAEEKARVKHNLAGVYSKSEKSAREVAKKTAKKGLGKV